MVPQPSLLTWHPSTISASVIQPGIKHCFWNLSFLNCTFKPSTSHVYSVFKMCLESFHFFPSYPIVSHHHFSSELMENFLLALHTFVFQQSSPNHASPSRAIVVLTYKYDYISLLLKNPPNALRIKCIVSFNERNSLISCGALGKLLLIASVSRVLM